MKTQILYVVQWYPPGPPPTEASVWMDESVSLTLAEAVAQKQKEDAIHVAYRSIIKREFTTVETVIPEEQIP